MCSLQLGYSPALERLNSTIRFRPLISLQFAAEALILDGQLGMALIPDLGMVPRPVSPSDRITEGDI